MPNIQIRLAEPSDQASLAALFHALWPDGPVEEHASELETILSGKPPGILPLTVFVAETADRAIVGFVEAALRSAADHCDWSRAVGYVEGWYVAENHRKQGIGRKLIAAAEDWARKQGCTEMASDTQLDNELSQRAHQQLGYEIVERAILFRKPLR